MKNNHYQPIENYGVIGDLRTTALVGTNGSIDFLCFPQFDSATVFARLLDYSKGGYFQISPIHQAKHKQMYLPETNILLTRFLFIDGIAEVVDFMPPATICQEQFLVRRVKAIKGNISFRMHCCPRFNYGKELPDTKKLGNQEILFTSHSGKHLLRLASSVPLHLKEGDANAQFILKTGETAEFLLEYVTEAQFSSFSPDLIAKYVDRAFEQTIDYWRKWSSKCTYKGRWREMVLRSALVLKLLISHEYGSIIAAPTFGLPERIGGKDNWDYRYVWIRDSAFTVYALMRIGYLDEAEAFMRWLEKVCEGLEQKGTLNLLYKIDGNTDITEKELSHLEGYMGSSPVRIGNAAHTQSQLDIYGDLMDSIYLYDKYVTPISHNTWILLTQQVEWVVQNWQKVTHGIWELRNEKQQYLFSRVMSWVAIDRAMRLANKRSFPVSEKWIKTRDRIYDSIFAEFWDEKKKAFVHAIGSDRMDASCLLMPLVRFISPKDPLWLSTLKRVEQELVVDALVYRFIRHEKKSHVKQEGTFSLCSFWYAECLSRAGELHKARYYFEKMLSFANHLGLYSEELGIQGEHLGNFPQAFSHLALISAAYDLDRRLDGA